MNLGIRWLWVGMLGGSVLLATGGNTNLQRFIGDVVGHFFSAGRVGHNSDHWLLLFIQKNG